MRETRAKCVRVEISVIMCTQSDHIGGFDCLQVFLVTFLRSNGTILQSVLSSLKWWSLYACLSIVYSAMPILYSRRCVLKILVVANVGHCSVSEAEWPTLQDEVGSGLHTVIYSTNCCTFHFRPYPSLLHRMGLLLWWWHPNKVIPVWRGHSSRQVPQSTPPTRWDPSLFELQETAWVAILLVNNHRDQLTHLWFSGLWLHMHNASQIN